MSGAEGVAGAEVTLLRQYRPLFTVRPAWRYAFLTGGRGSGKSWHTSLFLLNLTYEPGHVILFTRWTLVSAALSIIPEFREKIDLMGRGDDFHITAAEIVNKRTGSRILFRGIKTAAGNQTAALKSIQGVTTWVLDEAEELTDETSFDRIDLSIRQKGLPNRVLMVLNPSGFGHFLYKRFVANRRDDTLYVHTTWEDNRHNLSPSFISQAEAMRVTNPGRYAHLFGGEWAREVAGLLWTAAEVERCRLRVGPEAFTRVLVGVDPATTAKSESNETGIVVVGVDRAKKAYVLEDLSGRYSPNQWGTIAVDAARRWNGSIVAETNQGGDMVEQVIRSTGPKASGIRVIDVKASKGKFARAEPVYSLYAEGRVFHVGTLPILESQMIGFNPNADDGTSPDRVDALVWAVSALLLHGVEAFVV